MKRGETLMQKCERCGEFNIPLIHTCTPTLDYCVELIALHAGHSKQYIWKQDEAWIRQTASDIEIKMHKGEI